MNRPWIAEIEAIQHEKRDEYGMRPIAEVIQLEARRDIRNDIAASRAKADYQCDLESQLERATVECERLRLLVGTHPTGDRGPSNERYLSQYALVLRLRGELLDVRGGM